MSTPATAQIKTLTFDNDDDLRDHLDALNESGTGWQVAGMGSDGQPFLASLMGGYGEYTNVLNLDPWDSEAEHADADYCHECGSQRTHRSIEDLHYPVTVLVAETQERS